MSAPAKNAEPTYADRDDSWADEVADRVTALLKEEGVDLELVVFRDPVTETLHAVGFDGAPSRFFRTLDADKAPAPPASKPS